MITPVSRRIRIDPNAKETRDLALNELSKILSTPHFASSKRYPALLRYVVEKTLQGQGGEFKERTLGVEVFHRSPEYDTNSDTIVRFAASEVRKRLTLYYHESEIDPPVLIVLAAGSYVPEFFQLALPNNGEQAEEGKIEEPPAVLVATEHSSDLIQEAGPPTRPVSGRLRTLAWSGLVLGLIVAIAAIVTVWSAHSKTSLDRFWQPVRDGNTPVIICTGGVVFSSTKQNGMTQAEKTDDYPYISVQSAAAVARIADLMGQRHTEYTVQAKNATTLTDLRKHSVVLIGAYNNDWSLRVLSTLHYRFSAAPTMSIYDSSNPSRVWIRPHGGANDGEDYAIAARFRDPETEHMVVVIAGISKNGTEAAAQFVTSSHYLDVLDHSQSKDWGTKNLEVVLKTNVIDGKTGSPSVEAVYTW